MLSLAEPTPQLAITSEITRSIASAWASNEARLISQLGPVHFDPDRLRRFGVDGVPPGAGPFYRQRYLGPLVRLIAEYARSGQARYADAYHDELLRYTPHRAALDTRLAFFNELIPLHEAVLLKALPRCQQEAGAQLLQAMHASLIKQMPNQKPLRVLAFGDCLMNEVRLSFSGACRRSNIPLDFRMLYFSATQGRNIDTSQAVSMLSEFPADLIAFSFLSYKGIAPYHLFLREAHRLSDGEVAARVGQLTTFIGQMLRKIREHTDATFIVHNASGLPLESIRRHVPLLRPLRQRLRGALDQLNEGIRELVANTPNSLLLDEAKVAEQHGHRACEKRLIPLKIGPKKSFFHTAVFGEHLAVGYLDIARSFRALAKTKVLLVDFDNTLWDGVMAEGQVSHRHELQKTLRSLKEAGILLVAVSKNDAKNIRWDEMTLKPDDFVLQKIGWGLKAESIQEVAQQLDLGLDTFVLLDDNPTERELVRSQLPQVVTLDPNDQQGAAWLERMLQFPNTRQTEEAKARTELYRHQVARKEAIHGTLDYPAMMRSLELRVRFSVASKEDVNRVCELVQRTNQFNTTTIRYSKPQLLELMKGADSAVYVAWLRDKFGPSGLAALAVVKRAGADRTIESFVMSCRAMGLGMEQFMLRSVLDAEGAQTRFIGRFVPTDRNLPARSLFENAGFSLGSGGEWILEPNVKRPDKPDWVGEEQIAA